MSIYSLKNQPIMEIINFDNKDIRTIENDGTIWYSVVDVVGVLTNSVNPKSYWTTLKSRLKKEGSQVVTNCDRFKLLASDGKKRLTDCLPLESVLRLT